MLDYSIPQLQFLIGNFDASQYLDSIEISVPMHEPGQALLWSGQFRVSNNLAARIAGLTDTDFSEVGSPSRWRPYQQIVRLNIKGYQSPAFRIENYRYNPQTRMGEGRLTQIPTAVAGDRPGDILPTAVGGSIGGAIEQLLSAAFAGATVVPGLAIASDGGVLDVPLVTRDPWSDAVRLSGLSWHWLSVNAAETISSVNGAGGNQVFIRTDRDVELAPDLAAIFQQAQKVIVTGARQIEDALDPDTAAVLPTAPRPKFKTTNEYRPIGTVFSSVGTSTTPILFEEKTIIYQYWDDDTWSEYLPFGVFLTSFLFDIQSVTQSGINIYAQPPPDLSVPLQTITIKRQPLGYLFTSAGTDPGLIVAEVLIESNLRKLTIEPSGLLFNNSSTALALKKHETLTSASIPPGAQITIPAANVIGQSQKYEPRPKLEAAQPVATKPLKTELLKGEAFLVPLAWTPVFNRPLVIDFGFLPDQGRAAYLAQQIAIREQRRRDQVLVDMPIPSEWLALGWPLLAKCNIGDNVYLMDGCAISISSGVAKFGFAGALVSQGMSVSIDGVPKIVQQRQYQIVTELAPVLVFEAEISRPSILVESELIFEAEFTLE